MKNMYRKIEDKIIDFINLSREREEGGKRKCLLVDGLRQVGKTYSIRKACGFDPENPRQTATRKSFASLGEATCLYIAFDRNPEIVSLIDEGVDPDRFIAYIAMMSEFRDHEASPSPDNRVILVLDEIQLSKRGVNLLKYLSSIDGLTVIASGSMLGMLNHEEASFPIGYVEMVRMFPMDFEEFLLAHGYSEKAIASFIRFAKEGMAFPESLHQELSLLFRHYALIGGLPEYVSKYVSLKYGAKDLYLDAIMRLEEYRGDIAKYGNGKTKIAGREVFDSAFSSLNNGAVRYYYSSIKKGAKGREYKAPLAWLIDCGLLYKVHNLRNPELPLGLNEEQDEFRLYYADNLLIYAKAGLSLYEVVMDGVDSIKKGLVYENLAADILYPLTQGKLHYHSRKSGLEIDFVFEDGKKVYFVEIKSADNVKSKSLSTLMKEYPDSVGVRCSYRQNGKMGNFLSLPLYLLPFIDRII